MEPSDTNPRFHPLHLYVSSQIHDVKVKHAVESATSHQHVNPLQSCSEVQKFNHAYF